MFAPTFRTPIFLFAAITMLLSLSLRPLLAQDFHMTCPPGWSSSQPQGDLIKQCMSPGETAIIEAYYYSGIDMTVPDFLDYAASALVDRGMPFKRLLKEAPGNVSGIPALAREYRGDANGTDYHSYVIATQYQGITYLVYALFEPAQAPEFQPLVSDSLNSWVYPSLAGGNGQPDTGNDGYGRAYDFDDCWAMCRDYENRRKQVAKENPNWRWLYLLANDPNDSCRSMCRSASGLTITCGRELASTTLGRMAQCWSLGADENAMWSCYSRVWGGIQCRKHAARETAGMQTLAVK